jgi:hypothetical protein
MAFSKRLYPIIHQGHITSETISNFILFFMFDFL